jgi:hypothetical protein
MTTERITVPNLLLKALTTITSIGLAVSAFFLTKTYDRLDTLDKQYQELRVENIKITSSLFTSKEFNHAKSIIDQNLVNNDRRLLVLEENTKVTNSLLQEIRQDIKGIKNY